jgi:HEAT repeat protein
VDTLINIINNESDDLRVEAIKALGLIDDPRVDKWLAESLFLRLSDVYDDVKIPASIQFQKLDGQKTSQLLLMIQERLENINSPMRISAIKASVVFGMQLSDLLIPLLNDPAWNVRDATASALGEIKEIRAVQPLIALAKQEESQSTRFSAIDALGEIGDAAAVETLVELLKDRDRVVEFHAARALGKIGGEIAVNTLIDIIKQPVSQGGLAIHAAEGLGLSGDKKAVEPLFELLQFENSYMYGGSEADGLELDAQWYNISAAEALVKLGDKRVFGKLLEKLQLLTNNYQDIKPYPEKVKGSRGYIYSKDNKILRGRVIGALGELGNRDAIDVVKMFLDEEDKWVRMSITEAFTKLEARK